jgi:hypothetical protein
MEAHDLPTPPSGLRAGVPQSAPDDRLAQFLIHMFPIGHLPVPYNRPDLQLPAPPPELDYAAGLRFGPQDHPRSDLIDNRAALGGSRVVPDAGSEQVGHLTGGYDALGGLNAAEWAHRFLVRRAAPPEFAWPPAEISPEGGSEAGEDIVLPPGTLLDRFGSPEGRVFSADGTAFDRRALPPPALATGYHRYRVLRPLPVWRTVSAPWFGQPGGGERYRATYAAVELVALGRLAEIVDDPDPTPPTGIPLKDILDEH